LKKKIYKQHLPLKRYSQNFLIDQNSILKIIKKVCPNNKDLFIEIGAGLGELTRPLLERVNNLFLIEIDANLVTKLKKMFDNKRVVIFKQDVMKFDFLKFFNIKKRPIRIIGNIPYHISTKLILILIKYGDIFEDIHLMLQKEVANRLIALKNSKLYGRLSIISQYYCNIQQIIEVSSKSFYPKPKVDSCFIRLIPRKKYIYPTTIITMLSQLTKVAFRERRKKVRNSLSEFFNEQKLIELRINPCLRAQNISVSEYCRLSHYLMQRKKS